MNADKKKALIQKIEENRDEIIRCTQGFIRFSSISGREEEAQLYFASLLEKVSLTNDMTVDIWTPDIEDMSINPYFLSERKSFEGSPNVVGVLKGSGGGRSIILNGHVDVVPEGIVDWLDHPFSGKLEDGRIYGRGASDMKGGLIAAVMAVKAICDSNLRLKGDVIIQSVVEEETGGAGTLSAIKRGYKADAAIVPEPTDLKICPVSVGAMWFRVTVKGLSAHAATAYLGVSAINKAIKLIQAVEQLEEEEAKKKQHELYTQKIARVNIGTFRAGNFTTNVPEEAVFEGRMGIKPGEEIADVRKELEEIIIKTAREDEWMKDNPPVLEWYGFCLNSNEVDQNHEIVKTLGGNHEFVTKEKPVIGGTLWGSDAGALTKFAQTPAVVFGPGPGATAHKANEYIDVEELITTTKILTLSLVDWCGL